MKSEAQGRAVEGEGETPGIKTHLGPAVRGMIREPPGAGIGRQSKAEHQEQDGIIGTNPHLLPFLGIIPAEGVPRGWR